MEELKNHIQNFINIERERLEILNIILRRKYIKRKKLFYQKDRFVMRNFS